MAQTGTNYTLPSATNNSLGGIIVGSGLTITNNGTLSVSSQGGTVQQIGKIIYVKLIDNPLPRRYEVWTANYDGTNQTKFNFSMPAGYTDMGNGDQEYNPKLSPNGQKVFLELVKISNQQTDIFSANIDGSNLTKIIDGNGASLVYLKNAN